MTPLPETRKLSRFFCMVIFWGVRSRTSCHSPRPILEHGGAHGQLCFWQRGFPGVMLFQAVFQATPFFRPPLTAESSRRNHDRRRWRRSKSGRRHVFYKQLTQGRPHSPPQRVERCGSFRFHPITVSQYRWAFSREKYLSLTLNLTERSPAMRHAQCRLLIPEDAASHGDQTDDP